MPFFLFVVSDESLCFVKMIFDAGFCFGFGWGFGSAGLC